MAFRFEKLSIPDVILIRTDSHIDSRGSFMETYKSSVFKANGITEDFVQENASHSKKGVLRGLHYQSEPNAQGKLVRCARGKIFDVAVDIRDSSPTRGRWVSVILSDENHDQLYVPAGFAHGFCVMSDTADVVYRCTAEYAPECEGGIIWNDQNLAISWPIDRPVLSKKDSENPPFSTTNRSTQKSKL